MSQTLEDFCQQFIAGIAGMPGEVVRPRWQGPDVPNLPPYGTDWVAVGITRKRPIGIYGATIHQNPEPGTDLMQRHEEFDLLCSFYGPNADVYSSSLHDGLMIWQNKSELRLVGMAFVEMGMDVDQGRPNLATADIDALHAVVGAGAPGRDTRKFAVGDQEVRIRHTFAVDALRRRDVVEQADGHPRIGEPITTVS